MADHELETRAASDEMEGEPRLSSIDEDDHECDQWEPPTIATTELNRRVVLKLDLILLPFLSLFFLVNSLDRSNVGNAETAHFTRDAGLQPGDLNTAVACFFAFFVALQPVGAALGRRIGMRLFVPGCMVLWGFLTTLHIWITAKWQLILIRILIGTLEAGFYPTSVSYMSLFYTRYEFARRLGAFYSQYAIAGALGGILSYAVFSRYPPNNEPDSTTWKPWQFLFLLEGCLTIMIALLGFVWLPNSAETAWFFSAEERQVAQERIIRDRRTQQTKPTAARADDETHTSNIDDGSGAVSRPDGDGEAHGLLGDHQGFSKRSQSASDSGLTNAQGLVARDVMEAFTDWKVFYLLVVNILSAIPAAAFVVFLPLVVEGFGFDSINANLFTAPPFLTGAIVLWIFTWWSDRRQERIKLILWGLVILISGLTGVVMLPHDYLHMRYAALCVMLGGSFVASPLTIAWFTGNIEEPGKRSVVLGINGWGNLAGVFSSVLFAPRFAPDYRTPFFITLSLVIVSFVGFMLFRQLLLHENKRRATVLSHWDQKATESEMTWGLGPIDTSAGWLLRKVEALLGGQSVSGGRRGEDKLTFVFGL